MLAANLELTYIVIINFFFSFSRKSNSSPWWPLSSAWEWWMQSNWQYTTGLCARHPSMFQKLHGFHLPWRCSNTSVQWEESVPSGYVHLSVMILWSKTKCKEGKKKIWLVENSVDEYIVTCIFHTALFGLSVVALKNRRSSGLQVFETGSRVFYQDTE